MGNGAKWPIFLSLRGPFKALRLETRILTSTQKRELKEGKKGRKILPNELKMDGNKKGRRTCQMIIQEALQVVPRFADANRKNETTQK